MAKALELESWELRDVEILGGDGPPQLRLHGSAARARELGLEVSISLTHTEPAAAAVAVAAAA